MTDVSHELGSLRHIVDSPLSSKVAMFNKVADTHTSSQLLNPFSNSRGSSPGKPVFSKDEYGKPLAGSLTEARGQKANIHVCKEMLELCQVIDSEGFVHPENSDIKVIFFGDLFNIYNHISDKCVGLLLRARKHKLVDFEGEMLFQRRDDEVPIFTTKPILEIRRYLEAKQEEFRRSVSPAPRATSVIQDQAKRAASAAAKLASNPGTPRSLSPAANPEVKPTTVAAAQPTLRQTHSTPEIKLLLDETKAEAAKAEKNVADKTAEEKGAAKVTVYLTKAPAVETKIVEEVIDMPQIDAAVEIGEISDLRSKSPSPSNSNLEIIISEVHIQITEPQKNVEQKANEPNQIEKKVDEPKEAENKQAETKVEEPKTEENKGADVKNISNEVSLEQKSAEPAKQENTTTEAVPSNESKEESSSGATVETQTTAPAESTEAANHPTESKQEQTTQTNDAANSNQNGSVPASSPNAQ